NRLQIDWTTILLPSDRAAWMDRWVALSPLDIKRHVYTPYTPGRFNETLVQPETAYAWSQIYGVARFKLPIVQTPALVLIDGPNCTNLTLTPDAWTINYSFSGVSDPVNVQVYATGPTRKLIDQIGRSGLRPMCHM